MASRGLKPCNEVCTQGYQGAVSPFRIVAHELITAPQGLDASRYGLEQQIQEARLILERPEFQNYLYDLETDQLQNLATFEKARIQQREVLEGLTRKWCSRYN